MRRFCAALQNDSLSRVPTQAVGRVAVRAGAAGLESRVAGRLAADAAALGQVRARDATPDLERII